MPSPNTSLYSPGTLEAFSVRSAAKSLLAAAGAGRLCTTALSTGALTTIACASDSATADLP